MRKALISNFCFETFDIKDFEFKLLSFERKISNSKFT